MAISGEKAPVNKTIRGQRHYYSHDMSKEVTMEGKNRQFHVKEEKNNQDSKLYF